MINVYDVKRVIKEIRNVLEKTYRRKRKQMKK